MNANPGDIVECINDQPSSNKHLKPEIIKGQLYRVVTVTLTPGSRRPAYTLEKCQMPWSQTRFRKIDGNKDSFNRLLAKHTKPKLPVKVKEDA